VVDHSHRGVDVIRDQGFDIIKGENFIFENNTLNEGMLNAKQTKNNKKWLTFWSYFFNLLTRWLGSKLKSIPSLLRVYRVCSESTKKEFTQESTHRGQMDS